MSIANRQIRMIARPQGAPRVKDFRLERSSLRCPIEGQMLLRTLYLSLDPHVRVCMSGMQGYAPPMEEDDVVVGSTISRVEMSHHASFKTGDLVISHSGWQDYELSDGTGVTKLDSRIRNPTHALSVLGIPGFTAYHGLINIGKPKTNETVVVASACGAVGSIVGQLAKLKGARVVGIAGSEEKCRHMIESFGFDACVDHSAANFAHHLADACPNNIDIYFENVGGQVFDAVVPLLSVGARVPLCGLTAHYNDRSEPLGIYSAQRLMMTVLHKRVSIEGFMNFDHYEAGFERFMRDMGKWVRKGVVKIHENFVDGLERAPLAFVDLLSGGTFGKVVVRV
jgi:NADPH-dependent curcumin reductase CurA